jgi:hypothetical protein
VADERKERHRGIRYSYRVQISYLRDMGLTWG